MTESACSLWRERVIPRPGSRTWPSRQTTSPRTQRRMCCIAYFGERRANRGRYPATHRTCESKRAREREMEGAYPLSARINASDSCGGLSVQPTELSRRPNKDAVDYTPTFFWWDYRAGERLLADHPLRETSCHMVSVAPKGGTCCTNGQMCQILITCEIGLFLPVGGKGCVLLAGIPIIPYDLGHVGGIRVPVRQNGLTTRQHRQDGQHHKQPPPHSAVAEVKEISFISANK